MGLFSNEEEERERRLAAEANEQAEWNKRQAAESKRRMREAELDYEQEMQERREAKDKRDNIKAIAHSGRGDAILTLLHEYEKGDQRYNKTLINAWQVPHDKENFLLFAQTFYVNYDYFKQLEWKKDEVLRDYIRSRLNNETEKNGLRNMLIAKAKKVEQIYLKGQVPEAKALLDEVERRYLDEGKKEFTLIKWYSIAVLLFFAIGGIVAMSK